MRNEMLLHPLVWWRDVPIDVEIGLISYLSEIWQNEIYVVSANDYENARKACGWTYRLFSNVHYITGAEELANSENILQELIHNPECLHIFSGVKGKHQVFLEKLNKIGDCKCVFIMESTSEYGGKLKKSLKRIYYPIAYHFYQKKYKKITKGLFAMGENATLEYKEYGWNDVLPFMYLPNLEECREENKANKEKKEIKFLYVGRFDYATKGLNVLMKAFDLLDKDSKWHLDMVGGYGADKDSVIEWCNKNDKISYLGSWSASDIVKKMKQYDCCIVPSRCDGWNLTPQQAIHAGIGCIITNGAGSQEIISDSGAGMVVLKDDVTGLSNAIKMLINFPEMAKEWNKNAEMFVDRISVNRVGTYFVDALAYFYGYSQNKPQKPW